MLYAYTSTFKSVESAPLSFERQGNINLDLSIYRVIHIYRHISYCYIYIVVLLLCVYESDKNGSSRFDSLRFPPNPLSSCNRTSLGVCYVYKAHHLFFSHNSTTTPFVLVTVSTVFNRIIINHQLPSSAVYHRTSVLASKSEKLRRQEESNH
jgi:hypothetical protein